MKSLHKLLLLSFMMLNLATISVFGRVNVIHISTQDPKCFGGTDGYVTIDSLSTTPPSGNYTISINTTPVQFFNVGDTIPLDDGNYTIIVRDGNDGNFPTFRSFSIDEPFELQTIPISSPTSCFGTCDGSAGIIPFDGTPGYTYRWSDPANQTTATAINLCAGKYFVTVTDANLCTVIDSSTVTEPTQIQPNVTTSDVACFGDATGSATANPTGGIGSPYTYSWSSTPGNNSPTENNLSLGTYNVTVFDSDGCSNVESFAIGQPAAPLAVDTFFSDVACFGQSTGFVRAAGKDGTGPYTYAWDDLNMSTTDQVNNLPAGTYNVTVTDANGCTITASETISQQIDISISFLNTDVDCFGANTGAITATISGGFANYSVAWSDAASTTASGIVDGGSTTVNGLIEGNYNITVTDALGCTKIGTTTINEPTDILINQNSTDPTCNNGTDGIINITVTGGTPIVPAPDYTFAWSDNGAITTKDRTGLSSGTYTISVTDANNCLKTETIVLDNPDPIVPNVAKTDVTCFNGNDGTANVRAAVGGTGFPYPTYAWSSDLTNNSDTETGLSAGTYTVTITDANNCVGTETFVITQPATAVSVTTTKGDVACFGESTGFVRAQGGNGVLPFTYSWDDPANSSTQQVNNLPAGVYTVTVSDANACTATASVTIAEPNEITVNFSVTDVVCFGESNGAIDATISGGFANYSVRWSDNTVANGIPANGTTSLVNLTANNYSITVTDALGCTKIESTVVNEPPAVTAVINLPPNNPSCNGASDGSATVITGGGTPPITVSWNDPANQTTETATGLAAGTYDVIATDANGCTATDQVTLVDPAAIVIALDNQRDISCFGDNSGEINISVQNGIAPLSFAWSPAPAVSGQKDQTNLTAGTYNVIVTDANSCTATRSFTISQPATAVVASIPNATVQDASCAGINDGQATAQGNGGTAPYSFAWGPGTPTGFNTATISSLGTGTYTVTITDVNGCTDEESVTINQPNAIQTSTAAFDADCNGAFTGSVNVTVTGGGSAPFSFSWDDPASTANAIATGLAARKYFVTVTDINGCTTLDSATVNEPPAVTAVINLPPNNPSCNGASDGSATVTTGGGTPPITVSWNDPANQTTETATGLAAGTYDVIATDANGCTATDQVTLMDPAAIVIALDNQRDISCFGDNSGEINISVQNGIAPLSFAWSPAPAVSGQEDQTNLTAGTYTVIVTDANSCTATRSFTISQPATAVVASIPNATVQDASCAGINDGQATAQGNGGTAPYSFAWGPGTPTGFNTATISSLGTGTYTVTITDVNGCTDEESVTINQPNAIQTSTAAFDADCNGAFTGSVNVTVTGGGSAPFSFSWDDPASTANAIATGLAARKYFVTVTDINGCTTLDSATVNEPPAVTAVINLPPNNPSCNGASDGSATVTTGGGTPPITVSWNDPANQTTETATGLAAGTYDVIATDANGCTATDQVTLMDPAAIVIALDNQRDISCFGDNSGEINISVQNGIAPLSFAWSPAPAVSGQEDQTNLTAGTYTVIVTDANSCTATRSFTISQPATAVVASIPNATVQDASCAGINDGQATAQGNGGTAPYSFAWGPGTPTGFNTATISNLGAGIYTVTITDVNGCTDEESVTINQPNAIQTSTAAFDADCNGAFTGSVNVTVTGGGSAPFSFSWDDPANTANAIATGLAARKYFVTVTDVNGCTTLDSATVNEPTAVTAVINLPPNNPSCNGASDGSATVTTGGGTPPITVSWNDPANQTTETATGLAAGTYDVIATDANGCTATDQVTLVAPPSVLIALDSSNDVSCFGFSDGEIFISISGGSAPYNYTWNPAPATSGIEDQINLTAGTYGVTVTDANGCFETASFPISQPAIAVVASIPNATVQDASCAGINDGQATAQGNGGTAPYSFAWGPGTPTGFNTATISNLGAGIYTVTITDVNGCTDEESVTINQPNAIQTSTAAFDADCNGAFTGSVNVTVTGGGSAPFSFSWDDPANTANAIATGLAARKYFVTVTDVNGCTTLDSATVNEPTAVTAVINLPPNNPSCNGASDGSATVTTGGGTPPITVSWNDPANQTTETATGLAAGTYDVIATDANGCTATDQVTLVAPPSVLIALDSSNDVSCFGFSDGEIFISISGGSAPYNYTWNPAPATSGVEDQINLTAGTYGVTVTDANGCFETASFPITGPTSALTLGMDSVNVNCKDDGDGQAFAFASGGTTPYTFDWNGNPTGDGTSNITGLSGGTYTVTVTDNNGCSLINSVQVNEPADSLIATVTKTDITCGATGDGTATVSITGGTLPYDTLWSTNETTTTISNLIAGAYSITITDGNNCVSTENFTINSGVSNFVFTDSLINDSCNGVCDGFAGIFNLSGGNPPYNFVWDDLIGSTTPSIGGLCAGTYTVTISDNSGCDTISTIVINEPALIDVTLDLVSDTCGKGVGTASIVGITGGTQPYIIDWPPSATVNGPTASGLAAGSYVLTVTDGNGCIFGEPFTIDNESPLSIGFTVVDSKCFGSNSGSISVSAVGGVNPVTYDWSNPGLSGANPTNVAPGNYDITVTDNIGCAEVGTVTVNEAAQIDATFFTQDESCSPGNDGEASANTSGGTPPYTYSWSAGTPIGPDGSTTTGLSAGSYRVTITDSEGCQNGFEFDILFDAPFSLILDVEDATCNAGNDGEIDVLITGGTTPFTFTWSDPTLIGQNPTNASAGTYFVTVTDGTGCSEVEGATVRESSPIIVDIDSTDESCAGNDGAAIATPRDGVPPYSFVFSGGVQTGNSVTGLAAGGYSVEVTDANGCSKVRLFTINPGSDIEANEVVDNTSCIGNCDGRITLNPSGSLSPNPQYSYEWEDASILNFRANLCVGFYQVTITDNATPVCSKVVSIPVFQPGVIDNTISTSRVSCPGSTDGTATVTNTTGGNSPFTFTWGAGTAAGNTTTGLLPGTYKVTTTDANGCQEIDDFTIDPGLPLVVGLSFTPPLCNGGNDGTITSSVSGGTNPLTYDWTGGLSGANPVNVGAGFYEVLVTDGKMCTGTASVTVTEPAGITTDIAVTGESCAPGNDGAITLSNLSGGTTPYTFNWPSPLPSQQNQTGLTAGTYNLTIADNIGCTSEFPIIVNRDAPFVTTEVITDPLCIGSSDGSIDLAVTGSIGVVTFEWDDLSTVNPRNGLTAGNYSVTITDNGPGGCTETQSYTLVDPTAITVIPTIIDESCQPGSDGSISLNVSGGTSATGTYTYLWDNNSTLNPRNGLTAGTYRVTISDDNSCQFPFDFIVGGQNSTFAISERLKDPDCNAGADGEIDVIVSGAVGALTYNWNNGFTPSTPNRTGLSAGVNYTVTVTDGGNGCTAEKTYVLSEPNALAITFVTQDASCASTNNGEIRITTVSGGTTTLSGRYNFNWDNGRPPSQIQTGLSPNTYTVTITDDNACSLAQSFTIGVGADFTVNETITNVGCKSGTDGSISLNVTNAAPPVRFRWDDLSTTNPRNGLSAGTYSVTISDANLCSKVETYQVIEPDTIVANLDIQDASCNPGNDGTADATNLVTGGTPPFSFSWSTIPPSTGSSVSGLSIGNYSVTITDANSCSIVESFDINSGGNIDDNPTITDIQCNGDNNGSITVAPSGGIAPYTYLWDDNSLAPTRGSSLLAGSYTVTITDDIGCEKIVTYTLTDPDPIRGNITTAPESCNPGIDGTADASLATGGDGGPYSYQWSSSESTASISNKAAGTYLVTITDGNGCSIIETATINVSSSTLTISEDIGDATCSGINDGFIRLTVSGKSGALPLRFDWIPTLSNTGFQSNLLAGVYDVTITDQDNGCTETRSYTVNNGANLLATITTNPDQCTPGPDGNATGVTSGGTGPYTYDWPNSVTGSTSGNLLAGAYDVTITDANGCSIVQPFTIANDAPFTLTSAQTDPSCNGLSDGSIDLTVTGNSGTVSYTWLTLPAGPNQASLAAGNYEVTVSDAGSGCTETRSFTLTDPADINISNSIQNDDCAPTNDGRIVLTVTGNAPFSYAWSNNPTPSGRINPNLSAGTYTVTITDVNNCTKAETYIVDSEAPFTLTSTFNDANCNLSDGSINLLVSGSIVGTINYNWNPIPPNGNGTANALNLAAGNYSVTVTDAGNGCTETESFTIGTSNSISVTLVPKDESCNPGSDGEVDASNVVGGTAPLTYAWSANANTGNNPVATGLSTGTYSVTITDANGCTVEASENVNNAATFTISGVVTDATCSGNADGEISVSTTILVGIPTYSWNNAAAIGANPTGLAANFYTVTVTDPSTGCTQSETFEVKNSVNLVATTTSTPENCTPGSDGTAEVTSVTGGTLPYSYAWSNSGNAAQITGLAANTYTVTISDANGCSISETVVVDANAPFNLSSSVFDASCSGKNDGSINLNVTGAVGLLDYDWIPNTLPNSNVQPNLLAGNYFVTVTDQGNGCTETESFVVTNTVNLIATINTTDEGCNPGSDGTASVVSVSGGTTPYSYEWSTTEVTQSIGGLVAGNYDVTITDLNGCSIVETAIVDGGINGINYTISSTDLSCVGGCDGTATLNFPGGTTGYTFVWSPPVSGSDPTQVSGLCAQKYFVVITDPNGCVKEDSVDIQPASPILPRELVDLPDCGGVNNGRIVLDPIGGTGAPYGFNWSPIPPNGQGNASALGLSGGTYNVTISDLSCDTVLTFNLPVNTSINANITTSPQSCNVLTVCDGEAIANPTGGVAPYSYVWGPGTITVGATPNNAINLCNGNYSVTITDANGCSISESFTITSPAAIDATFTTVNSTCNICNGSIEATITSGVAPFTFAWFDQVGNDLGVNTAKIENLCSGLYVLNVVDADGCSNNIIALLNDDGGETINSIPTVNVSCFNGNDGEAEVIYTCGDLPCSEEWLDKATNTVIANTAKVTGLSSGSYIVKISNGSGCNTFDEIEILEPDEIEVTNFNESDLSCSNGSNGSISVSAQGGTGVLTYNWAPAPAVGQGTATISNLTAGNYFLTITDANSCSRVFTYSISAPDTLKASFTTSKASCGQANGFINAVITGGTISIDYDYQWFTGANVLLAGETNPSLSNVAAGTYALRVRDDNSCEQRFTTVLGNSNGPNLVVDSTKESGCFGKNNGAVFTSVTGLNPPFVYEWLPTGQTSEDVTNLKAGVYIVKVTDGLGCIATETITINGSSQLIATTTNQDAECGRCDGSSSISVTGGNAPYSYLWSNGSTSTVANDLCNGLYSVVITDANGCTISKTVTINAIGGPSGETIIATAASCASKCDGSVTVNPTGGTPPYSYLWQHNGAQTNSLSGLCPGDYILQVSDFTGCSRNVQVSITSPNTLTLTEEIKGASCQLGPCDGSALLNVSGGTPPYTFTWADDPSLNVNFRDNLCASVYPVEVEDANGCKVSTTITISNGSSPSNLSPTITDVSCFGSCDGSLISNLIGIPEISFQWLDNAGIAIAAPDVDLTGTVCQGIYILRARTVGVETCESFLQVEVLAPDSITLAASIVKNISCAGECDGEVFVSTLGGSILYSYSWDDPNSQFDIPALGLCEGTYTVTATDNNGCSKTTSVTLNEPPQLFVNITSSTTLNCSSDCDASATAVASGGIAPLTFTWDGGQTGSNPTDLCFGDNILTVTDANGCSVDATVQIGAIDTVVAVVPSNLTSCEGDSIYLSGSTTGSSVSSVAWYNSDTTTIFSTNLDTAILRPVGNYTFFLIASNGSCSDTSVYLPSVVARPEVGLPAPINLIKDEVARINVSGQDPTYLYNWTPTTALSDATIAEPITSARENITYVLTVTDPNNCVYADSLEVIYNPNIKIPSGFSPNGDGKNDTWEIDILEKFPNATVQVYNRWGQLLYEQNNGYVQPWDGSYGGKALPIATYYYVIDFKSDRLKPVTGPITILK